MNKYIFIQSKKIKVPILSAESEYKITTDEETVYFDVFYESLCAYFIFAYDDLSKFSYMMSDMDPYEIDQLVAQFKKDHTSEPVDDYSYASIPVIATDTEPLELRSAIIKKPIKISKEREEYLLNYLKDTKNMCHKNYFIKWFNDFCYQYGIQSKYKKDRGLEGEELAGLFCYVHGFEAEDIFWDGSGKKPPILLRIKYAGALWIVVLGYLFIVAMFLSAAYHSNSFFWGGTCAFIGFAMIAIPLSIILKK